MGDESIAVGIGLIGGGIIGYCVAAHSVSDVAATWVAFFVVAGMAFLLTLGITAATGLEEGILANAARVIGSEFGGLALLGAVIGGVVVGGITWYEGQPEHKDQGPSHSR